MWEAPEMAKNRTKPFYPKVRKADGKLATLHRFLKIHVVDAMDRLAARDVDTSEPVYAAPIPHVNGCAWRFTDPVAGGATIEVDVVLDPDRCVLIKCGSQSEYHTWEEPCEYCGAAMILSGLANTHRSEVEASLKVRQAKEKVEAKAVESGYVPTEADKEAWKQPVDLTPPDQPRTVVEIDAAAPPAPAPSVQPLSAPAAPKARPKAKPTRPLPPPAVPLNQVATPVTGCHFKAGTLAVGAQALSSADFHVTVDKFLAKFGKLEVEGKPEWNHDATVAGFVKASANGAATKEAVLEAAVPDRANLNPVLQQWFVDEFSHMLEAKWLRDGLANQGYRLQTTKSPEDGRIKLYQAVPL
jgi:hypothetical protein